MKVCGVYKIVNPIGKIYIGSSKNIYNRWNFYNKLYCKKQIKLYNSFVKYGVKNHIFEIIAIEQPENILKYEHILGIHYNVLDREIGLNLKLPRYEDVPAVYSNETKLKMSNSAKGNTSRKNKKASEESKLRMKLAKKYISDEVKLNMSNGQKNKKPISKEHRLNLSIAIKKVWEIRKQNNLNNKI